MVDCRHAFHHFEFKFGLCPVGLDGLRVYSGCWVDKINRVVHSLMSKAQFLLYLAIGSPFVGVDDGAGSDYFLYDG